jgi:hypothetical protein
VVKLDFVVETLNANGARRKVRSDGRSGNLVGDEGVLWDALQEAIAERDAARAELAAVTTQAKGRAK